MRIRIALALAVAGLLIVPTTASAAFHLMKISEVHEGGNTGEADYVELQMYSPGQRFVSGHYIRTYGGGGGQFMDFQFPSSVANGDSQRTILLASQGTIGVTPDFVAPVTNLFPGPDGSVCFIDTLPSAGVDCVSIGAAAPPTATPSPVGNPALFLTGGLLPGQSLHRTIEPGCSTLLESSDDTNDSATDFSLGTPTPRPNSATPSEHDCTPDLSLSAKKRQKAGKRVVVKAVCTDQDCSVKASGKIKLRTGRSSTATTAKKSFKLKKLIGELTAAETTKLKLKLSKSSAKKIKGAVKKGAKATATVTVKAFSADPEFDPSVEKQKTKLKK